MSENVKKIASIANDDKELLNGFKIFGVFPFYLKHIRTGVQIEICSIRDEIQEIKGNREVSLNDFYNTDLMKNTKPLIDKLIAKALINKRVFGWFLYPFILKKVKECNFKQINGLYKKIVELSDATFFLGCYHHLTLKDHTILKED